MNRRDGMRILHYCVHRPNLSSLLLIAKFVAWSGGLALQILVRFWFAHFWFAKSNAPELTVYGKCSEFMNQSFKEMLS